MKLSADVLSYIQNVVKTSQLVGIDNVIIEPNLVRAIDDNKTVVLFQDEDVPELVFGSIGLNRISVFNSRLDIARAQEDFSIEAISNDNHEFVRSLTMKGKGVKIDYRCANPATIQAPRQVNDTLKYRVQLTAESVVLLQRGKAAMKAETVTVISNNNGVSFELVDLNNDTFSYSLTTTVESLTDDKDCTFAHRYPVDVVLPLFKANPEGSFEIGQKGIMRFPVNGLNVFVLPQV